MKPFVLYAFASLLLLCSCTAASSATNGTAASEEEIPSTEMSKIKISAGERSITATLSGNSSARAFADKLKEGPVTVHMQDYGGFEKVGALGFSLPRNDESITTAPGDIILYQGNQITIYYDINTWTFTRLGKVDALSQGELKAFLGDGDVTLTFSLQ